MPHVPDWSHLPPLPPLTCFSSCVLCISKLHYDSPCSQNEKPRNWPQYLDCCLSQVFKSFLFYFLNTSPEWPPISGFIATALVWDSIISHGELLFDCFPCSQFCSFHFSICFIVKVTLWKLILNGFVRIKCKMLMRYGHEVLEYMVQLNSLDLVFHHILWLAPSGLHASAVAQICLFPATPLSSLSLCAPVARCLEFWGGELQ